MDREELLFDSLRGLHLLAKASKSTVVSDLCGLQAQFANNPKYALRIRASDFSEANWGDGLVKIWSFRSTLHAVRVDEIGLFLSARGVPDAWDDSWTGLKKEIKPYWCDFIYARILEGTSGRDQLKRACLNKGMDQDLLEKVFHGWGGLLKEMSARGMIAYDIGTDKRFVVCRDMEPMDQDEARTALIRRYFTSYGPATIADCATFTGFMLRETRRLIEQSGMPLESALCDGVEHFTLPPSTHSSPQEAASINRKVPECVFLAGFDQLIMGYKDRSRFMDKEDKRNVITNSGIVFPTVLLNGRLRARWKRDGQSLIITPFRRLSKREQDLAGSHGHRLFPDESVAVVFDDRLSCTE